MEWIPRYIKQTSAKRPGQIISAEDWNELFNLVIGQGDYTAEGLFKAITDFNAKLVTKADLTNGKIPVAQIPEIFKPAGLEEIVGTVTELSEAVPANNTALNARCAAIEEHINLIMLGGI